MRKKLRIGIAYDVKEDFDISNEGLTHCDFSTLYEIKIIKELLQERGHMVTLLGNFVKINNLLKENIFPKIDIVMNTAEGITSRNREGWLPSLFEINNIPYSGSDAYALNLTLNKLHTKIIAEYLGIPTPPYHLINTKEDIITASKTIEPPWILKPNYEGSSSGIRLVHYKKDLISTFEELSKIYQQPLLCESYIEGREIVVSLLYDGKDTKIIGSAETVRKGNKRLGVFSAEDKHSNTCTKIPVVLPKKSIDDIQNDAKKIHIFLGCNDYSRADFRLDSNGNHYFLELTPLPTIDFDSGFAKSCEFNNIKLGKVLEEIIYNAYARHKK